MRLFVTENSTLNTDMCNYVNDYLNFIKNGKIKTKQN